MPIGRRWNWVRNGVLSTTTARSATPYVNACEPPAVAEWEGGFERHRRGAAAPGDVDR